MKSERGCAPIQFSERTLRSQKVNRAFRLGVTIILAYTAFASALELIEKDVSEFDPPGWWVLLPYFQLLITAWCFFDGRARLKPIPPIGLIGLLLVTPIGLPIYLYWSRSTKN